jgi:hypothetical protein
MGQSAEASLLSGGVATVSAIAEAGRTCVPRRQPIPFGSRSIFPGDHLNFCLHEFLAEVVKTMLEVLTVHNDRYNYYLTGNEYNH